MCYCRAARTGGASGVGGPGAKQKCFFDPPSGAPTRVAAALSICNPMGSWETLLEVVLLSYGWFPKHVVAACFFAWFLLPTLADFSITFAMLRRWCVYCIRLGSISGVFLFVVAHLCGALAGMRVMAPVVPHHCGDVTCVFAVWRLKHC